MQYAFSYMMRREYKKEEERNVITFFCFKGANFYLFLFFLRQTVMASEILKLCIGVSDEVIGHFSVSMRKKKEKSR